MDGGGIRRKARIVLVVKTDKGRKFLQRKSHGGKEMAQVIMEVFGKAEPSPFDGSKVDPYYFDLFFSRFFLEKKDSKAQADASFRRSV